MTRFAATPQQTSASDMSTRGDLLACAVTPARRAAATRAATQFTRFLQQHDLEPSHTALTLYLTWLAEKQPNSGRKVRYELQLLDLDRRLRGEAPWSTDSRVRTFLRGLHHHHALTDGNQRCDPLYPELVHAVVDATMQPSIEQARATAAVLLSYETGLPATVLARLTWDGVRLSRDRVKVTVTRTIGRAQPRSETFTAVASENDRDCLVAVLHTLRAISPESSRSVLGNDGGRRDQERVREYTIGLAGLRRAASRHDTKVSRTQLDRLLSDLKAPSPAQLRDRALLLIGYGAALRTSEAVHLHQGDIDVCDQGLIVKVTGRREVTVIPRAIDPAYDSTSAWVEWLDCMRAQGRMNRAQPAFRQVAFSRIWRNPLSPNGINYLVQQRCGQACLQGHFTFTSLRTGMMRAAIRADARRHAIAAQADLSSLDSVRRHEERELILRSNVAAMLGL